MKDNSRMLSRQVTAALIKLLDKFLDAVSEYCTCRREFIAERVDCISGDTLDLLCVYMLVWKRISLIKMKLFVFYWY